MNARVFRKYEKFQYAMKNGAFASRALDAAKRPDFFRHFLLGRQFLPRQATALRALGDCMAQCRGLFTTQAGAGKEKRIAAFGAAETFSKKPNELICIEVDRLRVKLDGLARGKGVGFEFAMRPESKIGIVCSEYNSIVQALLDFSGAGSGGKLTVTRSWRGNLFVVLQTDTYEKQDGPGLALLKRMAAATGGSLSLASGDSMRIYQLVLPAKFGV